MNNKANQYIYRCKFAVIKSTNSLHSSNDVNRRMGSIEVKIFL